MTVTYPQVSFGLYALEVKQDATPSATDKQAFVKVDDLRTGNATSTPYASYEPDFWLLDGGYKFLPTDTTGVHVGLMSLSMSDGEGAFSVPPVLTVDFSYPHTTDGLTLHFCQYTGDYASQVTIAWYDAGAALIRTDTYSVTGWEYQIDIDVADFQQIVITFLGTNRAYRYLRLEGLDFGQLVYFTGADIKAASVIEETDMLSGEARYNSLELRLHSDDGNFSIINPVGYYQYLQQRQPVGMHEIVGTQSVFIGQFYTDTWENTTDTEIAFHCIDLLGILDTITYPGGLWAGTDLQTVIESILGGISVPYDLDSSLNSVPVTGWLPICTYREALQQLALACGAYLDCSRSNNIKIYPTPIATTTPTYTATITKADKGLNQSLTLTPLVTAVEVTAHNYVSTSTSKQLYSGTLAAGTHEITWNEPIHDLSATGATITTSGVNYAILTVAAPGAVTLTGQTYNDTKPVFRVELTPLPAGTRPNVLQVKDCTVINPTNAADIAQRIYDYKQQRYLQKFKAFAPTAYQCGDIVLVDTLYSQKLRCVVEKMSLDLAGGMTAQVEMTGVLNA